MIAYNEKKIYKRIINFKACDLLFVTSVYIQMVMSKRNAIAINNHFLAILRPFFCYSKRSFMKKSN